MKILMVVSVPFFHTQGTSFSSLDRALTLRDLGHDVDIITYPKGEDISIPGITVYRSRGKWLLSRKWKRGPTWYKVFLTIMLIPSVIKLLRSGQYDCLHAHEDAAFACAFIKPMGNVPFIYDMHSSLPEQLEAFSIRRKILLSILRKLEKFTIEQADAVMVICQHLRDKVNRMNPDKPVFLAENLPIMSLREIGFSESSKSIEEIKKEFRLNSHKIILYTGSLGKNQGIDLLLKAARKVMTRCADALFLIVGGEPYEIQKYQQMVTGKGLKDQFLFTGARHPSEMESFMELATCLVSPRITGKNTPLKIYTYLQSAKPVVATNLYTHTQVLTSTTAVLTDPEPDSYAEGIIWVLENPQAARKVGLAGKQLLEERYPRSEYINQHRRLYAVIESVQHTTMPAQV